VVEAPVGRSLEVIPPLERRAEGESPLSVDTDELRPNPGVNILKNNKNPLFLGIVLLRAQPTFSRSTTATRDQAPR